MALTDTSEQIHVQDGCVYWHCPGCRCTHRVPYEGPRAWTWNYSMNRPTLHPSIAIDGTEQLTEEERQTVMAGGHVEPRPLRCHSWVKAGMIEFCGDCTHPLKGQTVPCTAP